MTQARITESSRPSLIRRGGACVQDRSCRGGGGHGTAGRGTGGGVPPGHPAESESVKLELEEPWPLGVGLGVDDDDHYLTARLYNLVVPNQHAHLTISKSRLLR